MLRLAVVSAPWIALDSTFRGLAQWYVDGLAVDAIALGMDSGLANASRDLAAVPNVERVEPLVSFWGTAVNVSGSIVSVNVNLAQPSFDSVTDRLGIAWPGPPGPGEAVADDYFESLGLRAGDTLSIEQRMPRYDPNGTIIGWDVWTSNYTVSGFYRVVRPERGFTTLGAFLSLSDLARFKADLNLTAYGVSGQVLTWLNRDALLDPFDLSGSSARLRRQALLMNNAVLPHGFSVYYAPSSRGPGLDRIPEQLESGTQFLRWFFTLFTIPTLALAALLVRVGFEIGFTGRRRELAVLRARGLSVRGVRAFLFLEASVLGLIGGALGLLVGAAVSRLFLASVVWTPGVSIPWGDFVLTPVTGGLALLLAWALAVGMSRRLARILASEDLMGAFKAHHAEEVSIPHRASRDFLMAGIGAAGVLLLLAWGSVKDSPLSILNFLLGFSTAILAPVAPFFLTIAAVRYLTRGTSRPYRLLSRLLRPVLGELQPLVERNLARAPRRSSNITMVVTFAVGFVIAVLVIAASYAQYRERSILYGTPADIVAEGSPYGSSGPVDLLNATLLDRVRAVPGVATVSPVIVNAADRSMMVFVEASSYMRAVPWVTTGDLGGPDPAALMAALGRGDTYLANTQFANTYGVQIGDPLPFQFPSTSFTLRLAGVVSGLPGLYVNSPGDDRFYGSLTYADVSLAPPGTDRVGMGSQRYLIDVDPGADSQSAALLIQDILQDKAYVRTQIEARAAAAGDAPAVATLAFLQTQTQLALAMLVIAVGLFVYSASAERRDEMATLVDLTEDVPRVAREGKGDVGPFL